MKISFVRDVFIIAFIVYLISQIWYIRNNPEQVGYWIANMNVSAETIYAEYYNDCDDYCGE